MSFEIFLSDMGERPIGTTIDRINNDGNYEPGNCQWSTAKQQRRNQRRNIPRAVADQIRWARLYAGVTIDRLAAAFGISIPTVRLIVRGTHWAFGG
jgi:hypothetical protein